jgi:preprotein translocase SecE subunit
MASATTDKTDDEKAMATTGVIASDRNDDDRDDDERGGQAPPPKAPVERKDRGDGGGFFHIYKKGQGYWTRMGTAAAALVIAGLFVNFLWVNLPVWLRPMFDNSETIVDPAARAAAAAHAAALARNVTLGACAGFMVVYALVVFWLMNKPDNVDFLVATDSEMKKVNWTSRKELWGSTKVVIIFMFLIAFILFAFDVIFGYFFYLIDVLKSKPF